MGKSQLYLIDEREDLGFWIRHEVEHAEGCVYFAIVAPVLERPCDKQQLDLVIVVIRKGDRSCGQGLVYQT